MSDTEYELRQYDDELAQGMHPALQPCVEFEIVTGPPIPMASRTFSAAYGGGWHWVDREGRFNFSTSYEQACRDHREYVLEILSA